MAIAALGLLALPSAPAQARIDRGEAAKIAHRILQPGREPGAEGAPVRVFSLKRPLAKGTVILEPRTGGQGVKLKRRAWLFWEDLGHGLYFPHPSKLLFIGARSGEVVARRELTLYPFINGHLPAFLRSPRAYGIAPRSQPAVLHAAIAARGPDLSKDGMITIGQRRDPAFTPSFTAADKLAEGLGLAKEAKIDAEPSAAGLEKAIKSLIEGGKNDILIYIGGHGYPKEDQYYVDKDGKKVLQAPGSAKPKLTLDEKGNGAEQLTSTQLADLLRKFPQTNFKVIVDSCFGGRFLDDLEKLNGEGGPRNVQVAISSANKVQKTTTGLVHALTKGLLKWAAGAAPGAQLADGLREAFKGPAVDSWAEHAIQGGAKPQITAKPAAIGPPPPPAAPCTSTLVRSPGAGSFTAVNHIRVRATCNQAIRKVVVRSKSGDTFDACAQTAGTSTGCATGQNTLTTTWNQPANQELEFYGRVTGNADGSYHVQIYGAGDVLLHEYDATVP